MTPIGLLLLASVAAVLAALGVAGLRRWAERRRVLDVPNERSMHAAPTPRGGGLVIVAILVLGLPLLWWRHAGELSLSQLVGLTAGLLVVAVVSLRDDLRPVTVRTRFAAHALAAAIAVAVTGGWRLMDLPFLGRFDLGPWGTLLAFLWIVGLTNAYNFMDGIDGIAGVQAVVAGLGWAMLGALAGRPLLGSLGALIAGSSLGFLVHNWPPARIFMGDVGSASLGYVFSVMAVVGWAKTPAFALPGVLLVWPFVADASFTFLRRLVRGENVTQAHRSHLYQRLVLGGASPVGVAFLYGALAALGAAIAFLLVLRRAVPD